MYGLETLLLNLRKLSIRYDGDFKNIAKINVALCTKQNAKWEKLTHIGRDTMSCIIYIYSLLIVLEVC